MATLPRLQWLDGKEVSKSERILAKQVRPSSPPLSLSSSFLPPCTAYGLLVLWVSLDGKRTFGLDVVDMDNQHICKKLDVISIFDLQHYGELRERIVHQQMAYQTKRVCRSVCG